MRKFRKVTEYENELLTTYLKNAYPVNNMKIVKNSASDEENGVSVFNFVDSDSVDEETWVIGIYENQVYEAKELGFDEAKKEWGCNVVCKIRKVELEELEGLSFEEGKKILLEAGYYEYPSDTEDESNIADYSTDEYFRLDDNEDNEIDLKSFVRHWNRNNDPFNDDGSADFIIKEYWWQIFC